jgi:hypothetical protein
MIELRIRRPGDKITALPQPQAIIDIVEGERKIAFVALPKTAAPTALSSTIVVFE